MTRAKKPGRSPLSHVEERLRERALPAAADRGFSLLRSRERLRRLLEHLVAEDPRLDGEPRLALPLGPGAAPRLLVARDGAGVTCLAADMASTAPEAPWRAVEAFLGEEQRLFRAQVEAQREVGPAHLTPLGRAFLFPWRLVRAEMLALETLAPLFIDVAKESVVYAADALEVLRTKPTSLTDESAAAFWQLYAGATAWLTACRREPDVVPLAYALVMNAHDVHLAARALWILVSDPDRTFERTAELARGREVLVGAACRYVLPGIALRHPARAKDAARFARALLEEHPIADAAEVERAIRSLEEGEDELAAMLDDSAPLFSGVDLEGWRPFDERGAPPRTQARPTVALDEGASRSVAAWRRLLHARTLPLLLADDPLTPLLAALLPLEALLPGDEPDPAWRRTDGVAYVKGALSRMVRVTTLADLERAPQRREKAPGRNDPCPCGSGRKFKQCHGKA